MFPTLSLRVNYHSIRFSCCGRGPLPGRRRANGSRATRRAAGGPSGAVGGRGLSRIHAVGNGERMRPHVPFSAPSRKTGGASTAHRLVTGVSPVPTGGGAGRNTRGRVCSPKGTGVLPERNCIVTAQAARREGVARRPQSTWTSSAARPLMSRLRLPSKRYLSFSRS